MVTLHASRDRRIKTFPRADLKFDRNLDHPQENVFPLFPFSQASSTGSDQTRISA